MPHSSSPEEKSPKNPLKAKGPRGLSLCKRLFTRLLQGGDVSRDFQILERVQIRLFFSSVVIRFSSFSQWKLEWHCRVYISRKVMNCLPRIFGSCSSKSATFAGEIRERLNPIAWNNGRRYSMSRSHPHRSAWYTSRTCDHWSWERIPRLNTAFWCGPIPLLICREKK